jgi:hypothetical protein
MVAAQQRRRRRVDVAVRDAREHAVGGDETQHPGEGVGVHASPGSKFLDAQRLIVERVRHTEVGKNVDAAGNCLAVEQTPQHLSRRQPASPTRGSAPRDVVRSASPRW